MSPQAETVDVIPVVDSVPSENPAEEHDDAMETAESPYKPIEAEEETQADSVDQPTVTFQNTAESWIANCCAFGTKGNCTYCQQAIKHSDATVTMKESDEGEEELAHTDCYNKDQEMKAERAVVIQSTARRALARKEYAALKAHKEAEEQAAREQAEREAQEAREKAEAEARAAAEAEAAAAKLAEEQAAAEAAAAREAEEAAKPKKKKNFLKLLFGGCGRNADKAVVIPMLDEEAAPPAAESAMYPTVAEQMMPAPEEKPEAEEEDKEEEAPRQGKKMMHVEM